MKTKIPIVDLANLKPVENPSQDPDWISAAAKFREGFGDVGFLYLLNHGIPQDVVTDAFEQGKRFFDLPAEQKVKFNKDTSSAREKIFDYDKYAGYTPQGTEKLNLDDAVPDVKECFEWTDRPNCRFPDEEVTGFSASIANLDKECKSLFLTLFRLMAMALKLDSEFFARNCRHMINPSKYQGLYVGRLNYYPPITDSNVDVSKAKRCGEHTDYVFLTIDNVGGLEVKTVDGTWINADPIPGSIVINAGDLTEFWTSGIFPATPHRVFIPEENDERRQKSRFSIGLFCGAEHDTMITPMDLEKRPEEVKRMKDSGKVYSKEPISAYDHVMMRCANHTGSY